MHILAKWPTSKIVLQPTLIRNVLNFKPGQLTYNF